MSFVREVFGKVNCRELIETFGSPLYVYDEATLRLRCQEMRSLVDHPRFRVNYSAKANSNPELLKIIGDEGLDVDAMSPGEMYMQMLAGFTAERMMFIGNNVSQEEMKYAIERGILVSVDSLDQLTLLGEINKGGVACLRVNPGIGVGHHEKVVTAGKKAKFGIVEGDIDRAKAIAESYDMKIIGLNQHVGSLFLEPFSYLEAAKELFKIAATIPSIEIIDIGGGMGIPYQHRNEGRLDLALLGNELKSLLVKWESEHWPVTLRIEPGRYVVAECGALIGSVYSVKDNYNTIFVGTDVGFNVLARPVLYDSYHEISVFNSDETKRDNFQKPVYIVGNICESGDILAHDRPFPEMKVGDLIVIHDTGAYGYAMASNYNSRSLPAEALIGNDGSIKLIRKRQTLEDLCNAMIDIR